jgi:hypothetical protein
MVFTWFTINYGFLAVINLIITVKRYPEPFNARGQIYSDGQTIYGDIPEKVTTGSEEYNMITSFIMKLVVDGYLPTKNEWLYCVEIQTLIQKSTNKYFFIYYVFHKYNISPSTLSSIFIHTFNFNHTLIYCIINENFFF